MKALLISYYATNPGWKDKFADDTRDTRRRIIDKFCEKYGTVAVRAFTTPKILTIMEKRCRTPAARRNWITTIKHLFGHAVPTMRKDNPLDAIDRAKVAAMPKGNNGHHSWTAAQVATYCDYWPLGTKERLVMESAYETVSRRGEVVNLGPQHCMAKSGHKSLSEVERYTKAVRKKKLADSGAAKSKAARAAEVAEKARANPPRIVKAEKA